VLAAIIANLQNIPQSQPTKLPTIKIDRGGGGQSWPYYEIVDIVAAAATFMEISGEDPVARAVRRHRWIGQALPLVKEAREKREALAFLAGAQLGAAAEREAATAEAIARSEAAASTNKLALEQIIKIVDEVRGVDASSAQLPLPRCRGDSATGPSGSGAGIVIGLVVGVAIGIAIVGNRRRRAC
jgi:hypothetical protein